MTNLKITPMYEPGEPGAEIVRRIPVKVMALNDLAFVPTYETLGSACFDLRSAADRQIEIVPGDGATKIPTGLAFEIPPDHVLLVFARSGNAARSRVSLANGVGVIDSDYRGEVQVVLARDEYESDHTFVVSPGDRIAQAMVLPVTRVEFELVSDLGKTKRGAGGFGSTGR